MPSYQSSHTGAEHDQYVTKADLVDLIYPIGAIYISTNSADPSLLFGGSWTRIEDTFLLGAGQTYSAGATGGSSSINLAHSHTTNIGTTGSHILTTEETPAHTHTRGTMDITGTCAASYEQTGGFQNQASGAFYIINSLSYFGWGISGPDNDNRGLGFQASRNWTGETSSVGGGEGHTHSQESVETDSQLSSSQNILPPYLAVYIWKRVA